MDVSDGRVDWKILELHSDYSQELTEQINPNFGYIQISLTSKYRIVKNGNERSEIYDLGSQTSSSEFYEDIKEFTSPSFTDYSVSMMLSRLKTNPGCCERLRKKIVDFVVDTAIKAINGNGVKLFEVVVDLEVTVIDEVMEIESENLSQETEHGETCVVCLDHLLVESDTVQTNCSHIFHRECLIPWFERSNSCPLCRRQLISS